MGLEEVMQMQFVVEKLKEALLAVENFGGEELSWFQVAQLLIIAAVALTVLFYICRCWLLYVDDGGGGGGRVRMMRAPGRNCMMPRSLFESNPKGYFRNLRAHPGDQLC